MIKLYRSTSRFTREAIILLITGTLLSNPLFSFAQHVNLPANRKQMHHETEDDKYLPNAYNNKKTSPAYQYMSSGASKFISSSIYTIQVNVNSSGQNIIGDAANEPNIAMNPANHNNIVIGWRQFDNVSSNFRQAGWSYTTNGGTTWTFPGTIETGIFRSDPVLDFDMSGNFYYNSLKSDFTCKVFKSTNGGATWNNGVNAEGGDKQWMTIDRTTGVGSGNIYSFWTVYYSSCLSGFFTRSSTQGNSFENCTAINDSSYWGTMAIGNNGELYIVGAGETSDMVVEKSLNAQIPSSLINWNPSVHVFMDGYINYSLPINPDGLLGQANIDVDRSNGSGMNNVYILASLTRLSNYDNADIMFVKSTDGGLSWSLPVRVNDDASTTNIQWMGAMSVAPNGRIDAVWLDTRDDQSGSDYSALYYSYSIDQGNTWSPNEKLSASFNPHVGYPNQNKMGDYFDIISDSTGVHLAWANTFNGEEDVYYSHIVPGITGVNKNSLGNIISIYPNPTSGVFAIAGGNGKYEIEIYNVLGEKVYFEKIINQISLILNLDVPAGIYFIHLQTEQGSINKKIIINK